MKRQAPPAVSLIAVLILAVLAGCTHTPQRDGAPRGEFDPSRVKHVQPRPEPLSIKGNPPVYTVAGKTYRTLASSRGYHERGIASWYGTKFHRRLTANGERYDLYAMTAAHKTLPLPTYVRVTNLENGRSVIVRVNDRGPFHEDRIIDLSYAAAHLLGFAEQGTAPVDVVAIDLPGHGTVDQPSDRPIYLQAGAFREHDNAQRLQRRLRRELDSPVRIETPRRGLYRVRVGPLASLAEARRLSEHLEALGISAPLMVHD